MHIKLFAVLISMAAMSMNSVSFANETDAIDQYLVTNNQKAPGFKTLFLTQEQRAMIDKQREAYLNPIVRKPEKKIEPVVSSKPVKKRIYIPPKVAISAVIIKPDGSTIIRVNDKYNKSPSKHIALDEQSTTSKGVPITVNGQTQVVPVGQTLLTRKNKLVDTYKLNSAARKQAMPKTTQQAVKNRLDQVKILSQPSSTDSSQNNSSFK